MIQQAIDYLLKRGAEAQQPFAAKRGDVLVLPTGALQDLSAIAEQNAATPNRKKANVAFDDIASFCDYWKLHSRPESVIFGESDKCTFGAIFDYHGAGTDTPAGWRDHRAGFSLAQTVEWATWLSNNGQNRAKNQTQFAEFIEDNTPDIFQPPGSTKPNAADMLETARELEAKGDMTFVSSIRLSDGRQQFTYNEATNATVGKGKMDVPEEFVIRLVPYVGSAMVEVTARLRFRIKDDKLVFWYDLLRPHKVREDAFNSARARVEEETGQKVLIGRAG